MTRFERLTQPGWFDCQLCGACCYNRTENVAEGFTTYVEVEPKDVIQRRPNLMRRYVIYSDETPYLRMEQDGRCSALKGKLGDFVKCQIYESRPKACRRIEAGSQECLDARAERGIGQ